MSGSSCAAEVDPKPACVVSVSKSSSFMAEPTPDPPGGRHQSEPAWFLRASPPLSSPPLSSLCAALFRVSDASPTGPSAPRAHARCAAVQQRDRGSVRPELPERAVTMSLPIGPTESQNRNRAPSSRATAAERERRRLRQQDARREARAGGAAEHLSGEHRPALQR